eukprot:2543271-Amphidinium_carterae.1
MATLEPARHNSLWGPDNSTSHPQKFPRTTKIGEHESPKTLSVPIQARCSSERIAIFVGRCSQWSNSFLGKIKYFVLQWTKCKSNTPHAYS